MTVGSHVKDFESINDRRVTNSHSLDSNKFFHIKFEPRLEFAIP